MNSNNPTPSEIVGELDKYIISQDQAKKVVAIALRNRFRRRMLPPELQEEVAPKNIIMIGPTGVGKTEIARRLANLAHAPFIKVEATKYTEVGYVGRDVESMVRDLAELAVNMVRDETMKTVQERAEVLVEERILDALVPPVRKRMTKGLNLGSLFGGSFSTEGEEEEEEREKEEELIHTSTREKFRGRLRAGLLDDKMVEIEIEESFRPKFVEVISGSGIEEMGVNFQDMLGGLFPKNKKKKKVTVEEAKRILTAEEARKLIDMDEVVREAVRRTEETGIIFIDELDKIAGREAGTGPDVSREGVQRDILPIVEGSSVMTKYGVVRTDHVLFIAAGAFHVSKPSDLIPELQGRFPLRVELSTLSREDFQKILIRPKNALVKQYTEMLKTEEVYIEFTEESLREISEMAYKVNERTENIGARRLYTVMEKLLEDLSFNADKYKGEKITIDADYVREKLADIAGDEDLSKYIL